MRFATKMLLLLLLAAISIIAVTGAGFVYLEVRHLRDTAETSALAIARTVAAHPEVRREVSEYSPTSSEIINPSSLQPFALHTENSTGALFVVITDIDGLRLTHPDSSRLNEPVSTSNEEALRGKEVTAWETGTLGASARAKVPIFAPNRQPDETVGMVSVGFERDSILGDLPRLILGTSMVAVAVLAITTASALHFRRRWEQLSLGVQPEELVALVQNQAAVLDGVGDGVIALDQQGIVRVCSSEAITLLGQGTAGTTLKGRGIDSLGIPTHALAILKSGKPADGVLIGDRVLYLDARTVNREGQTLGTIIIIRDRTDMLALSERLNSVQAMTSALRVQRHEFANRMHVATGLIDAGRIDEAAEFLRTMRNQGPVDYPLAGVELLTDPFLQSFLGAKSLESAERGVHLKISDDTLVLGTISGVEDVATVLGNLVDNAVLAAASAPPPAQVEISLLHAGDSLTIVVSDSGAGIPDGLDIFAHRSSAKKSVHGHGIGLKLCRDLLRRRGGTVWIIDRGGLTPGSGATLGATLPGVISSEVADTTPPDSRERIRSYE